LNDISKNFGYVQVISGLRRGDRGYHGKCMAADIRVPDLRGGFSHMVAALAAQGTSVVTNVQLISRGYEHFLQKLTDLGAEFSYSE
jgi:UDP-N-acetylglucosamine enolpyruvyl transferase